MALFCREPKASQYPCNTLKAKSKGTVDFFIVPDKRGNFFNLARSTFFP